MKKLTSIAAAGGIMVVGVASATPAMAHGYVNGPESRSMLCKAGANTDCGGVEYEPQSLEGLKGFPAAGPEDGQIASAGGLFGGKLDEQSADRWAKTDVTTGPMQFDWTFTAPHKTSGWQYYMTEQGWDPNAPLNRAELQEIGAVAHDGSAASNNPSHLITVPSDRSGYHVILAVWDIADTVNAFYQVIDVNVVGEGSPDVVLPSSPTGLEAVDIESGQAALRWAPSRDDVGVKGYTVYRDGSRVGFTADTTFTDTGVLPGRSYTYSVVAADAAGNRSAQSASLSVTTPQAPDVDESAPSAPTYLHSMGVTSSSVDLMWGASNDDVAVADYLVFRDGIAIGSTTMPRLMDDGLVPDRSYAYVVKARDAAGNVSEASNTLVIRTEGVPAPDPTPDPTPEPTPDPTPEPTPGAEQWSDRGAYAKGDRVTFNGATYECIQGYQGWGDPNWINAPSLWTQVS